MYLWILSTNGIQPCTGCGSLGVPGNDLTVAQCSLCGVLLLGSLQAIGDVANTSSCHLSAEIVACKDMKR